MTSKPHSMLPQVQAALDTLMGWAPTTGDAIEDEFCDALDVVRQRLETLERLEQLRVYHGTREAEAEFERLRDLVEQLEALREASETARGWLYHGLNGGGMKSARKAFDVLDAEFHGKASSPAKRPT